ncbi:efflux RND transporter periplasmic adaptor subunit [Colwellia sp. 12G3]|uniref:efflux RND transporter periplasmic adaptor subunit n=1 Tax=Colwellia sp. 12G3 TaxID=2058299 RepID=UPI000C3363F6|nr:efflux RND transporter periplasmic adaptor subunit [Colwellia sp. 12G3]PKI15791.1 hypothetical protein CXF71_12340 [Colwellia sp. 12G3]
MNFSKSFSLLAAVFLPVIFTQMSLAQTKTSDNHEDETQLLSFTAEQMQMADINVAQLTPQYMDKRLYAPGEVQANGYTSYVVSPRVESVIVRRHAILGEHVEQGQSLVTLFSEDVAQAQALYRISYADWQRAKKVSKDVISESQLLSTETDYIAAYSRLKAYGLSKKAIDLIAADNSSALGEYTLKAERSGSVLSDDFQQGQRVSAGDSIMVLTDEHELWVEARLAANNRMPLTKGTQAQVILSGTAPGEDNTYQAEVIQQAHTIDPKTRTRIVRLKVKNTNHQLHPGLFVDVYFSVITKEPILVVPESALLRGSDGDWLIYSKQESTNKDAVHSEEAMHEQDEISSHVENDQHKEESPKKHNHDHNEAAEHVELNKEILSVSLATEQAQANEHKEEHQQDQTSFIAQEVELGAIYRVFSPEKKQWLSWREVTGVAPNSHFAITGAFFIASQGAKSGFDAHNH